MKCPDQGPNRLRPPKLPLFSDGWTWYPGNLGKGTLVVASDLFIRRWPAAGYP